MLPKYIRDISIPNAMLWIAGLLLVFLALPALAQQQPPPPASPNIGTQLSNLSPQAILENISKTIPSLTRMLTAIAYVMGMYFVIDGIVKLKHVGEMRTQMSYEHSLTSPILKIIIGALLIYLPSAVQTGLSTF